MPPLFIPQRTMCVWEHIGKKLLAEKIKSLIINFENSYKTKQMTAFDEFLNELEVEICRSIYVYFPSWFKYDSDSIFVYFNVNSSGTIMSVRITIFEYDFLEVEIRQPDNYNEGE